MSSINVGTPQNTNVTNIMKTGTVSGAVPNIAGSQTSGSAPGPIPPLLKKKV
jgi:hypothetical protein